MEASRVGKRTSNEERTYQEYQEKTLFCVGLVPPGQGCGDGQSIFGILKLP